MGGYEDDYLEFATRIVYEQVLTDHFAEIIPRDKFRVYSFDTCIEEIEMSVEDLKQLDKEYILNNAVSSSDCIYISEAVCEPGDEFVEFTKKYFKWLQDHNFQGHQDLYMYKDEGIQYLTPQEDASTRWDYAIEKTFGHCYHDDKTYTLERDTLDYLKVQREE